jgi:hypothetical protein
LNRQVAKDAKKAEFAVPWLGVLGNLAVLFSFHRLQICEHQRYLWTYFQWLAD